MVRKGQKKSKEGSQIWKINILTLQCLQEHKLTTNMAAFLTVFQHPVLVLYTFSFARPFRTPQPIVLTDWKIEVCRVRNFNIRGISDYERFFFFSFTK